MTMTTALVGRLSRAELDRRHRVAQQRASGKVAKPKKLPEYLSFTQVEGFMLCAPHAECELIMMLQWRAGLRISEALGVEVSDLFFDEDPPVLKVRWETAKRSKERLVPIHGELAAKLHNHIRYRRLSRGRLVVADRSTAWRWYKQALAKSQEKGIIPAGRDFGTHCLRHSAARHWLSEGVPINQVSLWLGHASLAPTLEYLKLLPDINNYMERVR
jgi:integrase